MTLPCGCSHHPPITAHVIRMCWARGWMQAGDWLHGQLGINQRRAHFLRMMRSQRSILVEEDGTCQ